MAEPRITHAQMAQQLAYLAKNVAAWSGDMLTLPEDYDRPASLEVVARFTDEVRARLDRLDEWAGRKKDSAHAR